MYYYIGETLECRETRPENRYVAVLDVAQWSELKDSFDMGIDLEMNLREIYGTKAEVNYDSLTGTFSIPNREDLSGEDHVFAFALDEKGIVFIDDSGFAEEIIHRIQKAKRWRSPGIERFLYDFLEQIVQGDLRLMEGYERELDHLEDTIRETEDASCMGEVYDIRGNVRDLRMHEAGREEVPSARAGFALPRGAGLVARLRRALHVSSSHSQYSLPSSGLDGL